MEAGYVAFCNAAIEGVGIKSLLSALGVIPHSIDLLPMWLDAKIAMELAKDLKYHKRSKHIDHKYYYVRYLVKEKMIKLIYVPTEEMIFDPMTKRLARDLFYKHVKQMRLSKM